MDLYLDLNKKSMEDSILPANKRAIERDGDDGVGNLLFDSLDLQIDEGPSFNEKDDTIEFSGQINQGGTDFGYLSMSIKLDFDDVISLIEIYRKRLGKLKTVMEAVKS